MLRPWCAVGLVCSLHSPVVVVSVLDREQSKIHRSLTYHVRGGMRGLYRWNDAHIFHSLLVVRMDDLGVFDPEAMLLLTVSKTFVRA